jgi:precorrin-6B methylase 2
MFLLSQGVERIVAVDLSLQNLQTLEENLTTDELSRILLLNASVPHLLLSPSCLDAIFALGVFHALPRNIFELACKTSYNLLKSGGLLVNSEATLEGALIYALVCQDIEEFKRVFNEFSKAVDIRGDKSTRVLVYNPSEVETMLGKSGFIVKQKLGISIFPSLIFGGLLPIKEVSEETKRELVNISDKLFRQTSTSRVIMYVSEKPAATKSFQG